MNRAGIGLVLYPEPLYIFAFYSPILVGCGTCPRAGFATTPFSAELR
jgi:hypothetical protein